MFLWSVAVPGVSAGVVPSCKAPPDEARALLKPSSSQGELAYPTCVVQTSGEHIHLCVVLSLKSFLELQSKGIVAVFITGETVCMDKCCIH